MKCGSCRWFGCVVRTYEDALIKDVYDGKIGGNHSKG